MGGEVRCLWSVFVERQEASEMPDNAKHQASRPCDCVGKTACMVFRIIRHLRCLPLPLFQFPMDFPLSL